MARAATRLHVAQDRQRVASELAPLMDHIHHHLFDPAFNIDHIDRAIGLRPTLRRAFRKELGLGLKTYITQLKRQTAEYLLDKTDLPIREIAASLNYSRDHNFSRDFRKWTGHSAAEFRRQHRDVEDADLRSIETRWKASIGCLDPDTMDRFVADLERRFPAPAVDEALVVFRGQIEGDEQARIAWRILQSEPQETWEHLLRDEIHFGSPALFELLSRESREQGRHDRPRGVVLAELALVCVEGSALVLGDRFDALRALALIRLAHAHRLAFDFVATEKTFRQAEGTMGDQIAANPRIEAEFSLYKGSFRLFQRQYDQAVTLLSRALAVAGQIGDQRLRAQSLLQRAVVAVHQQQPEHALPDLNQSLLLAKELADPELEAFTYHDLSKVYLETGDYRKANEALVCAERLYRNLEHPIRQCQLRWIAGQLHQAEGRTSDAEHLLREVRLGFEDLGEPTYAAQVSLELAMIYLRQGDTTEVINILASSVIPVFEGVETQREALVAFRLLKDNLASKALTLPLLEQTKDYLSRLKMSSDGLT